ncbi:MAG: oligopeptidase B, partial [Porphyromonadaceae bacterium]|nr:oligopeptidase B [Porphyromonadaceae bacterium]
MKHLYFIGIGVAALLCGSCNINKEKVNILKQSDFPAPPRAEVIPDTFVNFGQQRIDNYYWLKDKNNPKVIDYLQAENAYTETVMSSTKALQQKIYDEILGRI